MLVDTHCHLDAPEFDADRDAVVAEAVSAGVTRIVVPSVAANNFAAVSAVVRQYPVCLPAYGLHPVYAAQHSAADLALLEQQLVGGRAVAVGEIGLDGFDRRVDFGLQLRWFDAQLSIAAGLDLPVLLHVRHAVDAVIARLRHSGVRRGIAHAFNGSIQQAQQLIGMGFCLGFGGAFTWPRATRLRRLAMDLPLDSMVLETDAPDMSPAWARGERNRPVHVLGVARELASLRGITLDEVTTVCALNARRVLAYHE